MKYFRRWILFLVRKTFSDETFLSLKVIIIIIIVGTSYL